MMIKVLHTSIACLTVFWMLKDMGFTNTTMITIIRWVKFLFFTIRSWHLRCSFKINCSICRVHFGSDKSKVKYWSTQDKVDDSKYNSLNYVICENRYWNDIEMYKIIGINDPRCHLQWVKRPYKSVYFDWQFLKYFILRGIFCILLLALRDIYLVFHLNNVGVEIMLCQILSKGVWRIKTLYLKVLRGNIQVRIHIYNCYNYPLYYKKNYSTLIYFLKNRIF